jgi:MoaA/NifB/PqqE/SkfB family radical SAM enzyme
MRSAAIVTHLRCNQACRFCDARRTSDDLAFIAGPAVKGRVDAALAAGAEELVFTGGEPAMRADLPGLVRHARTAGARRVVLETNGTLVDAALAAALAGARLDVARVHLSGWGAELDAVTQDPGGFEAALRGVDALVAAGLAVELSAAVTRSTVAMVPGLPAAAKARWGGGVKALVLHVPQREPAGAGEVLPWAEAVPVVVATERAGRAAELPVRLHPATAPPPCVFKPEDRPLHLFALTPGARRSGDGRQAIAACAECLVNDRCPGVASSQLERFGLPPMFPITEERARRRLTRTASVEEQSAQELVSTALHRRDDGEVVREAIVRVQFQCNQSCRFCFVSTHLPGPGDPAVRAAIEAAGARGEKVVLSGGEPTLNPRLVEYVALAREVSRHPVQLQSNAVRLGDAALVAALVSAGLEEVFVSLHGSTAAVSDAVTSAPGTFARTVAGLDELSRAGLKVILNFVICRTNVRDLVDYVRLVAARWPRALVNLSFVAPSSDLVPKDAEMIPRYADALPMIEAAQREAQRLGVTVVGFESMCGIPLCLVPVGLEQFVTNPELPDGEDGGEFLKVDACRGCALERRCYGVRRGYVALYGDRELRRVAELPARG